MMFTRFIHVVLSFSTLFLYMAEKYSTIEMYPFFYPVSSWGAFVFFSVFLLLWLKLLWVLVYLLLYRYVFIPLGHILRSGIVRLGDNNMLNFWEITRLSPWWSYHFTFSPPLYEGCNFPLSSWMLVVIWHFDYNHPCGYEWGGISLRFWFPWWVMLLSTFSCAYWPFYVFFVEMFKSVFSWVICLFHWLVKALYIF